MAVASSDAVGAPAGEIRCAMCGCSYDPDANTACAGCPLNSGCALSCCPRCGFSSADPSKSILLRGLGKLRRS